MSIEIIAEVAQGFEGNPKLAELLALGAIRANADAVKYQLVIADELAVPLYEYYDLFKSLEMSLNDWEYIANLIKENKKALYFDVYGDTSLKLAKTLGATGVKISTTDFYNFNLVNQALDSFEKVYFSISGVEISEIDEFMKNNQKRNDRINLVYGFQAEPTDIEDNNLNKIPEFKKRYSNTPVGFMDHSASDSNEALYLPLVALGCGVDFLEKHITLDPILEIEDFISALEPKKFKEMVVAIRRMESAFGQKTFELSEKEVTYKNKSGKVVVAKSDLFKGSIIQENEVILKRVSTDGSPNCFRKISDVVGKEIKKNIPVNLPITKDIV